MRGWIVPEGANSLDSIHYSEDLPIPEYGDDDIRVKIHAASLNPADYKAIPIFPGPRGIGLDGAGVVDAVGSNVSKFKIGTISIDAHFNFCFPEYAVVHADTVALIPESVSFVEAAAIPCAGWTAYQALIHKMNIQNAQPGDTILITAGAGGVGGFAIQIANLMGLEVITTCSTTNFDYVKSLGAKHCIDYRTEDVVKRCMEITNGKGVKYFLDNVSAESAEQCLHALSFFGQITSIAGVPTIKEEHKFFQRALSVHTVFLGFGHSYEEYRKQMGHMGVEMMKLVAEKKLDALVSETITLQQVKEGLKKLQERHVKGKIVALTRKVQMYL